jgi:tetratricopeptide (TPR) repeat protein
MAVLLMLSPAAIAAADDEDGPKDSWVMDTDEIGKVHNGALRSDQMFEMGVPTASAMQLEGESSLRMGNIDRAILALQKSIELAPLDPDKRMLYAEALEKKLMSQKAKDRDPRFFNFVLKQWLFIYQKADFPDQKMQAGGHLVQLSGQAPRLFERPQKYLARVLLPEDGSKPVVLGGEKNAKKKIASKKTDADELKELDKGL